MTAINGYTGTVPNKDIQAPPAFAANADLSMPWLYTTFPNQLATFVIEANALQENVVAKEASAVAAANAALAFAAYIGDWAAQTGAKTVPCCVSKSGIFYALNTNIANVTTKVPGVATEWTALSVGLANPVFTGGAITLPSGPTSGRPIGSGYMIRGNSDTGLPELYDPTTSAWIQWGKPFGVEYFLVGGGSSGSAARSYYGRGGDGGQIIYGFGGIPLSGTLTVTIGAGGALGASGSSTSLGSIVAAGGVYTTLWSGSGYTYPHGGYGGTGVAPPVQDGGGNRIGGDGAIGGICPINGKWYAGGGGAGVWGYSASISGGAGTHGGGSGACQSTNGGGSGFANTGAGGGGDCTAYAGGSGGSGIAMLRYPDTAPAAISTTGSPTITVSGGYRTYVWKSSGSITWS